MSLPDKKENVNRGERFIKIYWKFNKSITSNERDLWNKKVQDLQELIAELHQTGLATQHLVKNRNSIEETLEDKIAYRDVKKIEKLTDLIEALPTFYDRKSLSAGLEYDYSANFSKKRSQI